MAAHRQRIPSDPLEGVEVVVGCPRPEEVEVEAYRIETRAATAGRRRPNPGEAGVVEATRRSTAGVARAGGPVSAMMGAAEEGCQPRAAPVLVPAQQMG